MECFVGLVYFVMLCEFHGRNEKRKLENDIVFCFVGWIEPRSEKSKVLCSWIKCIMLQDGKYGKGFMCLWQICKAWYFYTQIQLVKYFIPKKDN